MPETVDGESVQVIRRVEHLSHISPGDGCSYPAAATWCSHEHLDDLPDYLKPLARHWQANRPAPRAQTTLAAKSRPELAAGAHYKAQERHRLRQLARRRAP